MCRNAVVRSLEIIGEASKNIPDELRNQYNDIPWKRMAGMRDKLIHGYFGVNYESVWAVVTERILDIKSPLKLGFKLDTPYAEYSRLLCELIVIR